MLEIPSPENMTHLGQFQHEHWHALMRLHSNHIPQFSIYRI